jgi:hypothetical protein
MERTKLATSAIAFALLGAACITGCSSSMREEQSLQIFSAGPITATPSSAGTVYVSDASSNRVIYSGAMNGGDKIVVDPRSNVMTINAATVGNVQLLNGHEYTIRFKFDHK